MPLGRFEHSEVGRSVSAAPACSREQGSVSSSSLWEGLEVTSRLSLLP